MRQQLSPEKAKAAWELQAKTVAAAVGANADQTKGVVKAYSDARTSLSAATEKLRAEAMKANEGGGQPDRAAMREKIAEVTTAERAKLEKALAGSLSAEQTKKAMVSLGGFNVGWDSMTDTLAGFNLEPKKLDDAMKATNEYFIAIAKARDSADQEALRTTMQESRQKLNDTMKKLLTEEQFGKFEASTGGRGRGGQGGGQGGPGGQGGGGAGGRPPRRGNGGGGEGGGGGAGGGGGF
jgi:hypothetical protein